MMIMDHVGMVVADLDRTAANWQRWFGFPLREAPVVDPIQKVRVAFMETGTGATIELVEPHGPDSPVQRALDEGGGLNHLCFRVPDLDTAIEALRSERAIPITKPAPAVAFGGKRICFLFTADKQIIELVEFAP